MQGSNTIFGIVFNGKMLFVLLLSVLYADTIFSQQSDLSSTAQKLVYSNPDEAIKISEHILKTLQDIDKKAPINLMISRSFFVKGDYNNAIIHVFEAGKQVRDTDLQTQIEINLLKARLLRLLYLDNQSLKFLQLAEERIPSIKSERLRDSLKCNVILERIELHLNKSEDNKTLNFINETSRTYAGFLNSHPQEKERLYIAKAKLYRNLSKNDSAFVYIEKILDLYNSGNSNNLIEKAFVLNELGHLYLQKKEFKNSEEVLFIALRYAGILNNQPLLEQINRNLAINYLASNQQSKHKVYNDEFLVLNNQVELMEQQSINTVYNILNQQNDATLEEASTRYQQILYFSLVGVVLIVIIGGVMFIRNQWRKKRLNEIIRYVEISRNDFVNKKPPKSVKTKKIIIPEETENAILNKLKRFESSKKFLQKDMSLAVLSGQFETNTKYLSEIINKHYHDNFNTFINKLRIDFIIDKLKTDHNYMNYKISVLADESGFSSHSSFATVFKSIVGMSPGTFIDLLREEREKSIHVDSPK